MIEQGDRVQRGDEKRLRVGRGRIHASVEARGDASRSGCTEMRHVRVRCHLFKEGAGEGPRI